MFRKPSLLTKGNREIISFHLVLIYRSYFFNVEIGLLESSHGKILLSKCPFGAYYYEKKNEKASILDKIFEYLSKVADIRWK